MIVIKKIKIEKNKKDKNCQLSLSKDVFDEFLSSDHKQKKILNFFNTPKRKSYFPNSNKRLYV